MNDNIFQNEPQITVTRYRQHLLYKVQGVKKRPLRFDLIDLSGAKVRTIDLLYGDEFVVPVGNLNPGEYLYMLSTTLGMLKTGICHI
ncbi:MAG: hypothetical protein Kow0075_00920 [Salibacteraceae bacterium]